MTSSLTTAYALVGEDKPSQQAHQVPRYFSDAPAPAAAIEEAQPAVEALAVEVDEAPAEEATTIAAGQ